MRILLILLLSIGHSVYGAESAPAEKTAAPPATAAPAAAPDKLQECLDDRLRKKAAADKAAEEAAANRPPDEANAPTYPFHPVKPEELPKACNGNLDKLKESLRNVQKFCGNEKLSGDVNGPLQLGCKSYSRAQYCAATNSRMLELANTPGMTYSTLMDAVKNEFDWYQNGVARSAEKPAPDSPFQFTGYYGAEIDAHAPPCNDKFPFPLYRTPKDLRNFRADDPDLSDSKVAGRPKNCGFQPISGSPITICRKTDDGKYVPYYTRREIDAGHVLNDKGLEIGCAANAIDVEFFRIQGDGRMYIKNDKGETVKILRLNTDQKNGRSGTLLGNIIRCAGGTINSMTSVRQYLVDHDRDLFKILNKNDSYLFFEDKPGDAEPKGVSQIPLTEGNSLATDRRFIRTGVQTLFNVPKDPAGCSLANAVDSGSAVNNMHADMYKGEGKEAFVKADALNAKGSLFVAVPKNVGTDIDNCK